MRIPETWNFKYATQDGSVPPTPVTLMHCDTEHIPLADMQKALSRFKAATASTRGAQQSKPGLNDDLSGGMEREYPPTNIDEVAKHCPFVRETLEQGGANLVDDPQWHLAAALSCHCDDPSKTVHRLCEKGPQYSFEGTEEKLRIAQQQRASRETIGPPKCEYIHTTLKAPQCATCPHLKLGTTPLNVNALAIKPVVVPSGAIVNPLRGNVGSLCAGSRLSSRRRRAHLQLRRICLSDVH